MTPDSELLRRYASDGDETAFAELVHRHLDLVYAAAWRLAQGNVPLAEDVTQTVFTDLARKAGALRGHPTLTGWLHTSARYAALTAMRNEQARRAHEQEACAMPDQPTHPAETSWTQLRPVLDEALGRLRERDRDAVLLRFFQNKSYREVGGILGVSENAAQMRVERALDKLRGQFSRRGVATTAALLASALGAHGAAPSAPAGLAAAVAGKTLAGAPGVGATAAHSWFAKQFLPVWVGAGALAIVALILIFHHPTPPPTKVTAPVAQNSLAPTTPMNVPSIPNRGIVAAAIIAATSAATGQSTSP